MKMTLVIGIIAVVLVGGLLFAGSHVKNSFAHDGDKFLSHMVDKLADKLDLNADQKEQLRQNAQEINNKHEEMNTLKNMTREKMLAELRKETIDKENLDALYSDTKSRFDEMYDLFSARFVEFHQTLTPEQREKLVTEIEKHKNKHHGFHRRCKFKS